MATIESLFLCAEIVSFDGVSKFANFISASQTFSYDKLDRLLSGSGAYGTQVYEYDANTNRTAVTLNGARSTYTLSTTNNWLLKTASGTVTNTIDANGNMMKRGNDTFVYDSQNRLTSATVGSASGTYRYNYLNQRIAKTVAGTTTNYIYGLNGELLAEIDPATNTTTRQYIWLEGQPLAYTATGAIYYVHNDHLGTPEVLTDSNGSTVWRARYAPFGAATITGSVMFNLRFPGQYFDAESGLHYNWNRYYDTAQGRYITSDPIGLNGGLRHQSKASPRSSAPTPLSGARSTAKPWP